MDDVEPEMLAEMSAFRKLMQDFEDFNHLQEESDGYLIPWDLEIFDHDLRRQVLELSALQQERICQAKALLSQPPVGAQVEVESPGAAPEPLLCLTNLEPEVKAVDLQLAVISEPGPAGSPVSMFTDTSQGESISEDSVALPSPPSARPPSPPGGASPPSEAPGQCRRWGKAAAMADEAMASRDAGAQEATKEDQDGANQEVDQWWETADGQSQPADAWEQKDEKWKDWNQADAPNQAWETDKDAQSRAEKPLTSRWRKDDKLTDSRPSEADPAAEAVEWTENWQKSNAEWQGWQDDRGHWRSDEWHDRNWQPEEREAGSGDSDPWLKEDPWQKKDPLFENDPWANNTTPAQEWQPKSWSKNDWQTENRRPPQWYPADGHGDWWSSSWNSQHERSTSQWQPWGQSNHRDDRWQSWNSKDSWPRWNAKEATEQQGHWNNHQEAEQPSNSWEDWPGMENWNYQ